MLEELYNYFKQHLATDVYYGYESYEIAEYEVIYKWIKLWVTFTTERHRPFYVTFVDKSMCDAGKNLMLHDIVLKSLGHDTHKPIKDPKKVKIWIDILKDPFKVDEMLHLVEACVEEYNDNK